MPSDPPHSASLRKGRFSNPGAVYFVTTNTLQRQPLLTQPAREIIIASLKWSRDAGRIWLLGYVVMDDHFHALFALRGTGALPWVMNSLKRHCARQVNQLSGRTGEVWQEGYHDHMIRDEPDFWQHVRYMQDNPVRRGLVERGEDYAWSSSHPSRLADIDWQAVGFQSE